MIIAMFQFYKSAIKSQGFSFAGKQLNLFQFYKSAIKSGISRKYG